MENKAYQVLGRLIIRYLVFRLTLLVEGCRGLIRITFVY